MPNNQPLYSEIKARLEDWLQSSGGSVVLLPLDLLNRAQDDLTLHKQWSNMMFTEALTPVEGEPRTYSMPDGMASYQIISSDHDGDGKPDEYFYDRSNQVKGYKVEDRFDITTGHAHVILFYRDPSVLPNVYYQKALTDFQDTDTPQYSFFPSELLLRTAQKIHIEETGLTSSEVTVILNSQKTLLKNYTAIHHNVNTDLKMEILDYEGHPIQTEAINLTGCFDGDPDYYKGQDNSVL